jgi:hypothetical protein
LIDGLDANGVLVAEIGSPGTSGAPGFVTDTDIDASSALAAAANNVTLPGIANQTTFISGFEITGDGATAASDIAVTVTGILGGTKTYNIRVPAGAGVEINRLIVEFARPIPASAANTAIVVNVPSFGAGNLVAAVTAHGFQRSVAGLQGTVIAPTGFTVGVDGLLIRTGLFLRFFGGALRGGIFVKI